MKNIVTVFALLAISSSALAGDVITHCSSAYGDITVRIQERAGKVIKTEVKSATGTAELMRFTKLISIRDSSLSGETFAVNSRMKLTSEGETIGRHVALLCNKSK